MSSHRRRKNRAEDRSISLEVTWELLLRGRSGRRHGPAVLHALHHRHLLVQQVVEQQDLIFQLQAGVVRLEEVGVLLLQLLQQRKQDRCSEMEPGKLSCGGPIIVGY